MAHGAAGIGGGRAALLNELEQWCVQWCFTGWNGVGPQAPLPTLQAFEGSPAHIEEANILPACSAGLAVNRVAAGANLIQRLQNLGYDMNHDYPGFQACAAAAWSLQENRAMQLQEVWALKADITNVVGIPNFLGAKSIVNIFKLCRAFSR
jgi:hypothetical protein